MSSWIPWSRIRLCCMINMICQERISSCLLGRIGWYRQLYNLLNVNLCPGYKFQCEPVEHRNVIDVTLHSTTHAFPWEGNGKCSVHVVLCCFIYISNHFQYFCFPIQVSCHFLLIIWVAPNFCLSPQMNRSCRMTSCICEQNVNDLIMNEMSLVWCFEICIMQVSFLII